MKNFSEKIKAPANKLQKWNLSVGAFTQVAALPLTFSYMNWLWIYGQYYFNRDHNRRYKLSFSNSFGRGIYVDAFVPPAHTLTYHTCTARGTLYFQQAAFSPKSYNLFPTVTTNSLYRRPLFFHIYHPLNQPCSPRI